MSLAVRNVTTAGRRPLASAGSHPQKTDKPRHPDDPPQRGRGLILALAGGVTAATLLSPGATSRARADTLATLATEISTHQRGLNDLIISTEKVVEQYNAGRIQLVAAESTARDAAVALHAAEVAVTVANARRRDLSTASHRAGSLGTVSSLLSGDPASALDRAGALNALGRRARLAETAQRTARHERDRARVAAERAVADRRRHTEALLARKAQIGADIARTEAALRVLAARYDELARQARKAEEAARRARERTRAEEAAARARAADQAAADMRGQASRSGQRGGGSGSRPGVVIGGGGAAVAVREAFAQLGKPYVWGSEGPGSFDCSGLSMWVWAKAGVALSHYTGAQWNEGRRVAREELLPGDLVFFGPDLHHVGISIGGGKMIHAPRTGTVVRVEGIWWSSFRGGVRPG